MFGDKEVAELHVLYFWGFKKYLYRDIFSIKVYNIKNVNVKPF